MITLLGRTLDIPASDRVIGQQGDSLMEIRQFKITDPTLFGLSFKLDTETSAGKDIYDLTKTAEDGCIILTWTVTNLHTRVSGDIHVQLRGFDESGCVWHSYCDYFCVNDSIYTTEDFMALSPTEFEEIEQRITDMKKVCENSAAGATETLEKINTLFPDITLVEKTENKTNNFGSCKNQTTDYPTVSAVGNYVKDVIPTITLEDYLANPATLIHETGKEFYTEPNASVSNPFYCSEGDNIKATLSIHKGNFAVFVTYDKNDNIVTFIGSNNDKGYTTLINIDHTFTADEYYFRIGGVIGYQSHYSLTYTSVNNKWQNLDEKFVEQSKKTDNVEKQVFSLCEADYDEGYINASGTFIESDSYRATKPIFVNSGTVIKYKLKGAANVSIIALYENSDSTGLIGNVTVSDTSPSEGEYTTTQDGYIRFVNFLSHTDGYVRFTDEIPDNVRKYVDDENKNFVENFAQQSKKTDDVKKQIFSLYGADYEQGYIKKDGVFRENTLYRTTTPIFIEAGEKLKYNLLHGATETPIIAFYSDAEATEYSKEDSLLYGTEKDTGEYTAPKDGYIRFVDLLSHTDGYVYFTDEIPDNVKKYVNGSSSLGINILCLGDSIFGNDGEIAEYLAEFAGANVINGAIGGTRVSIRPGEDKYSFLDGQNLVQALTGDDWSSQDAAVEALKSSYTWLPDRIATLKNLDMSAVDLVIMDWGTNDYTGGHTIEEILTAYGVVIDLLQSTYPELRILITTPIWRYFDETENGDNKVYNISTLKEIADDIETFAKEKRISVLNAYQNMPLCYNTAATYFDKASGVHLNKKGNMLYAHLLNGKIRSMY